MKIVCLDIGNSSAHWGLWEGHRFTRVGKSDLDRLTFDIDIWMQETQPDAVSWCSVVPSLRGAILAALDRYRVPSVPLTHQDAPGLPISYPNSKEIGSDRLANAIGAQATVGTPAIVVDLGTATTFDIVGRESGYLGGIICPGMNLMTDYLHERTAQLPLLKGDDLLPPERFIGKSTVEAMRIGCVAGYRAMIAALLDELRAELGADEGEPQVVLTGGAAEVIASGPLAALRIDAEITLRGLAEAQLRRTTPAASG